MICGRKRRTTSTTSLRTESRGQNRSASSSVLEYPKSYARVKNWRAPSIRRAASSSSERMTPSSGPSSGPMRFCPPSPRLSDKRSEEHTSELQSPIDISYAVFCLKKKKKKKKQKIRTTKKKTKIKS